MRRRLAMALLALAGLFPFFLLIAIILRPDPVTLWWNFKKGQVLRVKFTAADNPSIFGAGGISEDTYSWAVTDVDPRGVATLVCTHESTSIRSVTTDYDSRRDSDVPAELKEYVPLIAPPFTVSVSPQGYVLAFKGEKPSPEKSRLVSDCLDMHLPQHGRLESDGSILWHATFPEKGVRPGDSWSLHFLELPSVPIETKTTQTYTLEKVVDGNAHIVLVQKQYHFTSANEKDRKYIESTPQLPREWKIRTVFSTAQGLLVSQEYEYTFPTWRIRREFRLLEVKSGP